MTQQPGNFDQLIDILEQELEVLEDSLNDIDPQDLQALRSAIVKLRQGRTDLTPRERRIVQFSLEDLGELYRFSGTTAGFRRKDVPEVLEDIGLIEEEEESSRLLGQRAALEAMRLGIVPRESGF